MSEWIRPEDAMPKNGVPVIVAFINANGRTRRVRAAYYAEKTLEWWWGDADYADDETFAPAGWYEENDKDEVYHFIGDKILAWQPFPPLPDWIAVAAKEG